MKPPDRPHPPDRFPTTRWSRVGAAGDPASPGAREALAGLCAAYWYPVYAFIRRAGHDAHEALDLAQDYFARLLEKGTLAAADPARGRFRTFLLADCRHFLANRRDRERALKRGGGATLLPIDARDAEGRYRHEPVDAERPERRFMRDWALSLIDRSFARLEQQEEAAGRAAEFALLRPLVAAAADAASYASVATTLGTTEGAVRVTVHRLRARFAAAMKAEVAATLDDPSDEAVADELRELFRVLGS